MTQRYVKMAAVSVVLHSLNQSLWNLDASVDITYRCVPWAIYVSHNRELRHSKTPSMPQLIGSMSNRHQQLQNKTLRIVRFKLLHEFHNLTFLYQWAGILYICEDDQYQSFCIKLSFLSLSHSCLVSSFLPPISFLFLITSQPCSVSFSTTSWFLYLYSFCEITFLLHNIVLTIQELLSCYSLVWYRSQNWLQ